MAGIEPAHAGTKTRCLTTWLHPKHSLSRAYKYIRKNNKYKIILLNYR